MVNFEDGTLVKGAYVVINGVEYSVVMPEYSGNTPVSSENLNKIQIDLKKIIDDLTEKNIISLKTVRHFQTLEQSWTHYPITNMQVIKMGNKLSYDEENYAVKIGKGVSKIKVSVSAGFNVDSYTTTRILAIDKKSEGDAQSQEVISAYNEEPQDFIRYKSMAVSPFIMEVQENDLIFPMLALGNSGKTVEILNAVLLVEVME